MIKLREIEGNRQKLDGGSMFGNAPRSMWEKWHQADSAGRIELSCRCLLLSVDGTNFLFETGIGAFFEPKLAERYGVQTPEIHCLRENLAKQGFVEKDIHWVILSHMHFDHAGGLLPTYLEQQSGNDSLLFPNATYVVSQTAWDRAQKPHMRDRASFIPGLSEKLLASKRLLITQDKSLKGFENTISFIETNGHTPGQMHSLVSTPQGKFFFCGDLIPGQSWLNPAITMGYDRYPEKLIDEKLQILQRASDERWHLFFTHDPDTSCAQIHFDGKVQVTSSLRSVLLPS